MEFFTEQTTMTLAGIIAAVAAFILRLVFKENAAAKEKLVLIAVEVAYNVVNDISKRTENKIDDKIALALGVFRDYLGASGVAPTQADEARAKILWSAMHGQGK